MGYLEKVDNNIQLENNKVTQAQHAAPLWKFIALYGGNWHF